MFTLSVVQLTTDALSSSLQRGKAYSRHEHDLGNECAARDAQYALLAVRLGRADRDAIQRYGTAASARKASFESFSPFGDRIVSNRTPASVAMPCRRTAWRRPAVSALVAAISMAVGSADSPCTTCSSAARVVGPMPPAVAAYSVSRRTLDRRLARRDAGQATGAAGQTEQRLPATGREAAPSGAAHLDASRSRPSSPR